MSAPTPAVLSALPLFPLGTVLFPGGVLPLRVFEVRYLDMVRRCHKAGAPFGVVALTEGVEVRVAGAQDERFANVGTLAQIDVLEAPQAGLLQIECTGTRRFRLRHTERLKHGLWVASAELLPDDLAMAVPSDLQHVSDALQRLIDTLELRKQSAPPDEAAAMRLPIAPPWRLGDCGWVANRWSELLPMQPALKQRLMELDSPLMRLELVGDLLARHGIAG